MVVKYLTWLGYRATRVNVQGRLIDGTEKTATGDLIGKKKFIKSTTRKGSADVSSTIKGRSVMWEIKIGKDKPSADQLKEQQREEKAGGLYFFIKTPEDFFYNLDTILQPELFK